MKKEIGFCILMVIILFGLLLLSKGLTQARARSTYEERASGQSISAEPAQMLKQ